MHGRYQGNKPFFQAPPLSQRKEKPLLPKKSDHLSKPQGLQTPQQQPNTGESVYFMKGKHSIFLLHQETAFGFLFRNNENYSQQKEKVRNPGCRCRGLLACVCVQIIREELRIFTRLHKLQQHRGGDDVIAALKEKNVSFSFPVELLCNSSYTMQVVLHALA